MTTRTSLWRVAAVVAVVVGVGAAFINLGGRHRALLEQTRLKERLATAVLELEGALSTLAGPGDGQGRVAGALPPRRASDGRWVVGAVPVLELLDAAGIPDLITKGLEYEVSAIDPYTGLRRVLARSTERELVSPAVASLRTGGGWQLALSSDQPSTWRRGDTWLTVILTLVVATTLGLVTHDVTTHVAALREALRQGEQRLLRANQRLMDEVQQREEVEQQFAHAAFHDAVTGRPNRRHFATRLGRALYRIRRQPGAAIAVLVVGVDQFKAVNETFGYAGGNELLRETARRLVACTEPLDLGVARTGGDEFALLLEDESAGEAAGALAARVQEVLAAPFRIGDETVFITASVGIATRSSGFAVADDVIREADIALSRAKADGRARHAVFDAGARDEIVGLQQLETDLRLALEGEQFRLHFQPIVELATGRVAGLETLIRWEHPRRGLVSPHEFVPAAEQMGLIGSINRWVVRAAAVQLRRWRERIPGDFYVSTNLSAHDLQEADLCDFIEGVVRQAELPAGALRVEVTEGTLIEDVNSANAFLSRLRQIGVPVLLDDFGTGYSSLGYLDRFEVDYLKIDRAFVHRRAQVDRDSRILNAILHLAQDLGIAAIAEGVETEDELRMLVDLRCDFGQGYYFSKPLPAAEVERILIAGSFFVPEPHGADTRRAPGTRRMSA